MRKTVFFATVGLALVLGAMSFAGAQEKKESPAAAALEKLKKLAGDWTLGEGKGTSFSYRVVSSGSAVMETLFPGTPHEMITMYHLDGGDLVLTHYCALGNQPRMKAKLGGDPKTLAFEFAGGSNLDPASDRHMHEAKIVFVDDDHMRSEWTTFDKGAKIDTKVFELARLKK
jgi:hypothetical protein